MGTEDYKYLWESPESGWVLVRLPPLKGERVPCLAIQNLRTQAALIIEDDALYESVKEEMLRRGVPVVEPQDS